MKSILVVTVIVGFVAAEVPSHSYLPPPPRGYSSGPAVVAARALQPQSTDHSDHNGEHTTVGYARSSQGVDHSVPGLQARINDEQGYDQNAAYTRNGLDDVNSDASYHFGYDVNDVLEGIEFGHHESRFQSRAQGSYHVVLPDGRKQTVSYDADERGYKPQISYEDSDDLARSSAGYDANPNTFRGTSAYGVNQDGANSQNGGRPNGRSNGYN